MRNVLLAVVAVFSLSGCSWDSFPMPRFLENLFPKKTKVITAKFQKKKRKPKHKTKNPPFANKSQHKTRKNPRPNKLPRPHNVHRIRPLPKTYLYYLHSASLPELRHYLDSGKAAEDLPLEKYILLRERRKGMEEDALLQYGTLKELINAYEKNKDPRFKRRILELMKEKEKEAAGG